MFRADPKVGSLILKFFFFYKEGMSESFSGDIFRSKKF